MSRAGAAQGRRPAGPTLAQGAAFRGFEEANIQQPWQNPTRSGVPDPDAAVNKDRFPAEYIPRDPYDSQYAIKQQIAQRGMYGHAVGQNAIIPQQVIPITETDVEYVRSQAQREEYAQFKVWCDQWFDFTDPAQVRLYEEAFPDYYEERANLIKNMGENMTKFAILRLLGPRTRDDFMYLWLVQTGKVPLINGPLWDPRQWANQGPQKKLAFFNPWRLINGETAPNMPDPHNRTDPVGDQRGARLRTAPSGLYTAMQGWPVFDNWAGGVNVRQGGLQGGIVGLGRAPAVGALGNPAFRL